MSLRPTGHRILVKPDAPPELTTSGLILPQDRDHVPVSGTVVALGPGGSQIRHRTRQRAFRDCLELVESTLRSFGNIAPLTILRDEMSGLIGTSCPEREIAIGDRVAYPVESGLALTEDGVDYIILNEDDVAVIVTEEAAAAA